MRVTFRNAYGSIDYVQTAAAQMAKARQQVQSGKRVEKPSDDPAAMRRAVEGRTEMRGLDAYSKAADSALAKLTAMDTVLTGVVDKLTQANVAVMSARGSTVTAAQREAAAMTLEGIRDALVTDLNTKVRGAYVFGGGEGTTVPYVQTAGVWTYQGDNAAVSVDVGPDQAVEVALDGQALAQGSDTSNILNELEALIVAVRAGNDASMATGVAAIDRAFSRATRTQTGIGVDQQEIDERQLTITSTRLGIASRVSKDEDADLAMAITEMTRAQAAYEAAIGAIGTASRASLLDYLR